MILAGQVAAAGGVRVAWLPPPPRALAKQACLVAGDEMAGHVRIQQTDWSSNE